MRSLADMIWVELRKVIRSRMPLWTSLGALFMPLGIAFLIFVARNPEISKKLGLISAKANLMSYATTDWTAYIGLLGQIVAAGGFFLFVLIVSWVFGREFTDGTLKDMLAVPVRRSTILLAKFIVAAVWSALEALLILVVGLVMGAVVGLPGGSLGAVVHGIGMTAAVSGLVIAGVLPFALLASVGRGYLLPVGAAILLLMLTNLVAIAGWGEYFPWAVPGLVAQAKSSLTAASYWVVALTGVLGMFATYLWWRCADQNR